MFRDGLARTTGGQQLGCTTNCSIRILAPLALKPIPANIDHNLRFPLGNYIIVATYGVGSLVTGVMIGVFDSTGLTLAF